MSVHDSSSVSWAQRSDAFRDKNVLSFDDLLNVIEGTYRTYSKLCDIIGPWNSKQQNSSFPYQAPSKDFLHRELKRPSRGISDYMHNTIISSTIKFCESNKGKKQLITPHPSTHHSAHFPEETFSIKYIKEEFPELNKSHNIHFKPTTIAEIKLDGISNPIYVENLKERKYKYLIVRPKLGKLGTASVLNWEVLFFTRNFGFHLEHCDSNLNPRYSGVL